MIHKLLIIAFGIFLVISAGTCSLYPLYLSLLKTKFGYSLTQLNLYGSFINIGLWVAFTVGIIYDKLGPKISCIVSLVLLPGSYAVLNIILRANITSLNLIWLLILGFLMGQGSALAYTTALTTNLKNFNTAHSSAIVGLIVSNMAISPSIFTSFKEALSSINEKDYFVIVGVFIAVIICICIAVFENITPLYSSNEKIKLYEIYKEERIISMFIVLNIVTLLVYIFGVVYNNLKGKNKFPNVVIFPLLQSINFVFVIMENLGFWDKLLFNRFIKDSIKEKEKNEELLAKYNNISKTTIEMKGRSVVLNKETETSLKESERNYAKTNREEESQRENKKEEKEVKENKIESVNNKESKQTDNNNNNKVEEIENKKSEKEVKNNSNNNSTNDTIIETNISTTKKEDNKCEIFKILFSKEIILLFILLTLTIGSVISNLNNVQFITHSLIINPSPREVFEYAILYFTFNSFARILTGLLLSTLIKLNKLFHFVIFISFLGLLSQILGIAMNRHIFYLSIALAGTTHGCYMTFIPIYCSVTYSVEVMGTILGFLTTGNALGSLVVGSFIFTAFFEKYKNEQGECYGKRCFRGGYIITSLFMIIGVLITIYLFILNKRKKSKHQINDSKVIINEKN